MSEEPFDPQKLIDAMAPFLGLEVAAEYRPGVAAHLSAAHRIAQDVLAAQIDDDAEQAPVFRP